MKRFFSTMRLDALLQLRYGFYYAAAFVTLLWIALLHSLPGPALELAVPFVVFADLAVVGYVFIAGAVLFEKGEKTLFALVSTPLRLREYLASKLATLTALAVVMSLAVVVSTRGADFDTAPLVLGVIFTSLISLLLGFIVVSPFTSISAYLIPGQLPAMVLMAPLAYLFGLWESPVLYVIPTHGSLLLLGDAFGTLRLSTWQLSYAVLYQLLWIGGLVLLAYRAFDRYVVPEGG